MALDITADTAQVAIVTKGTLPSDADWHDAAWVRSAPTSKVTTQNPLTTEYRYIPVSGTTPDGTDTAYLRVLVGPGGDVQLPATGSVDVWVKVVDNPETVVLKVGSISVA